MQVFTNLQFKLFWALGLFCYVLFIGEAGWGQRYPACEKAKEGERCCLNFDTGGSCRTWKIKGDDRGRTVTQTSSGSCISEGRRAGEQGCVRSNYRGKKCDWSLDHCTSETLCKNNVGPGHWNGRSCQSSPVSQQASDSSCSGKDVMREQSTGECMCRATGELAENGKCKTSTNASNAQCPDGKFSQDSENNDVCDCDGKKVVPLGERCNLADDDKKENTNEFAKLCREKGGDPTENGEGNNFCECKKRNSGINVYDKDSHCDGNAAMVNLCRQKGAAWSEDDGGCFCDGRQIMPNDPNAKCETSTAVAEVTQDDIEKIMDRCGLNAAADQMNECGDQSLQAAEACDKKAIESDKNNETAKGILNIIGGVHQQKGVQAGNAEVCSDVAKKTTAAYWALDKMRTTCEDKIASCKKSCSPFTKEGDTWESLSKRCSDMVDELYGIRKTGQSAKKFSPRDILRRSNQARNEAQRRKNGQVVSYDEREGAADMAETISQLRKFSDDNIQKCEGDAPAGQKDVVSYLEDVLKGWVSANACKNAATTNANRCAQLGAMLTPQWCAGRTSEPCCSYVDGGLQCKGKDSTHIHCICQNNQSDSRCITTTGNGGGNAQLAAPGSTANLAAPGGIKAGALNKPSNFSNDGFAVNEDPNANGKGPAAAGGSGGSPFGGTSGGGGGGAAPGAASGGGAGDGKAAQGEGESQGLVGGAFSALKTLSDRVFGGGGSVGKTGNGTGRGAGLDKNGKKKIDPEKWRPTGLRGVAGAGSELGPKNRDIWKQMNSQYATQYHTFLDGVGK